MCCIFILQYFKSMFLMCFFQVNSLIARILQNITNWDQYYDKKSFLWCWCLGCMLFHVSPQQNILFAWVIAFLASKGFLASVWKSMILQTAWILAREVALIACKRFLSRMLSHVNLEITSIITWIATLITPEMLLPWMCWHVQFEVTTWCEERDTLVAMEWFSP